MHNAVFVIDQHRLDHMVDAVTFTDVEPRITHIYRKIEDYLLLEAPYRRGLLFKRRLGWELGPGLWVALGGICDFVDNLRVNRQQSERRTSRVVKDFDLDDVELAVRRPCRQASCSREPRSPPCACGNPDKTRSILWPHRWQGSFRCSRVKSKRALLHRRQTKRRRRRA